MLTRLETILLRNVYLLRNRSLSWNLIVTWPGFHSTITGETRNFGQWFIELLVLSLSWDLAIILRPPKSFQPIYP